MLWEWMCSPGAMGCEAMPMSCPNLRMRSPGLKAMRATLWPAGISEVGVR